MLGFDIVILGGGFGGTTLAQRLERRLPGGQRVALLSKNNFVTYSPLLPEVVGASILPGHVVAPIRQMTKRSHFYMVRVTAIDLDRQQIHYRGMGPGVIHYEQLVLACGVAANLDRVPGLNKYGLPLKTLGDALYLRNRVMVRLEQAELQTNPEARRCLTTFVVVGGGFSGVEVAGEITDFLRAAVRYYPQVDREDCRVVLLHDRERILPELSPRLGDFALRKMRKGGIDIRLNARVNEVKDQCVTLESGERLYSGTVISTVGTGPNPLIAQLPVPKQRGRVETAADMSVPDYPGLWALGDCAAVVNAHDGRLSPPTAQFAVAQAKQLADNLARSINGNPTRPFSYRLKGQLSSIGHNKAVAEVFGFRYSGFVAWLLWRGFYLLKIPTLARKARLYFEWNWEMLFPPDIVYLRFSRTRSSAEPTAAMQVKKRQHA
ncbi:MAG: NAD(P)/FAD-dependent oxidoreductase [Acidiferrobacterales bacterium]